MQRDFCASAISSHDETTAAPQLFSEQLPKIISQAVSVSDSLK
jgi:hypothetical protein